jgi:predicted DsbA family dithiol-disulfide isomerase
VEFKPYQIDPGIALDGEEFEPYCIRRWGSSEKTKDLRSNGAKDGATFGDWKWWPNTLRGHQFVQYGNEKHSIDTARLNNILFRAMYEEGANLSLVDSLVEIAEKEFPDWNKLDLRNYLENNQGAKVVRAEIDSVSRKYRISGVPYFLVEENGSKKPPYAFSGAQPTSTFTNIFEEFSQDM